MFLGGHAACTDQLPCQNEYNSTSRVFSRISCCLTEVPPDIPAQALEVKLHHNSITSLPAGVFSGLGECEVLHLENNEISLVNWEAFTGMESLEFLWLFSNKISLLEPGTFAGLKSLKGLDLARNLFTTIPSEILSGLDMLDSLQLHTGQIMSVEKGAFDGLKLLRQLRLDTNEISDIEPGTFSSPNRLIELQLYQNRLSKIKTGTFAGLSFLQILYLSLNQIDVIENGAFDTLFSIKVIQLDNNRLTNLSPDLFINMPRPLSLTLQTYGPADSNGFLCRAMCWLKHEQRDGTVLWPSGGDPRCIDVASWTSLPCGNQGRVRMSISHNTTKQSIFSAVCLPIRPMSQPVSELANDPHQAIRMTRIYGGVSRNLQIAFSVESLTKLLIAQRQTRWWCSSTTTARVGAWVRECTKRGVRVHILKHNCAHKIAKPPTTRWGTLF